VTIEELIEHLRVFDQRLKVGTQNDFGDFQEMDKCDFDAAYGTKGEILKITPPETINWAPWI